MSDKNTIRKSSLIQRNNLPQQIIISKSFYIQEKIIEYILNYKKKNIISYIHWKSEVQTTILNTFLIKMGFNLAIPKITTDHDMHFSNITSIENDLQTGRYGILEPIYGLPEINNEKINLAIVPGVAFDKSGIRLGYGKGYYDYFLNKYPQIITLGVCFECQLYDFIPPEAHDHSMDFIITEKNIINCKKL